MCFGDTEMNGVNPWRTKSARTVYVRADLLLLVIAGYRHRMVINRPMIINAKPIAKFHGPSSSMNGIFSAAM